MKKNRLFVVLLLISLLIMTITACGGSESNGEPAEAVSETSEQAETPDPAETPETSETAEPGDDTTDNDSGVLDPEFKKTMDDYEAWFNHYCEVMKKYEEDPSDLELMSEVADLLTEEQEMLDEMDKMDQSEMNEAELAYYIEVTARIEKKLLEVAY